MKPKKIIKNKILDDIADAETYYLASTIDKNMLPVKIGGRWELMKITEKLEEDDVVFQYGGIGLELYIFVSLKEIEIKKLVESIK